MKLRKLAKLSVVSLVIGFADRVGQSLADDVYPWFKKKIKKLLPKKKRKKQSN